MHYKLLFITFLCVHFSLSGQEASDTSKTKKIDLIHADSLEYNSLNSNAQKLKGNVAFRYKDTDMFCDSAFMFKDSNVIKAYSNVRIKNNEGVQITGDSLTYYGDKKLAKVIGRVKLLEKDKTLDAPIVEYNMDSKIAYYFGGGKLVDKSEKSTLTSKVGYYYTDIKKFFFKTDVVYTHPDYVIKTDTMMHHTESDITYFLGPTHINYDQKTNIYCKYGWFNQKSKDCKLVDSARIERESQIITADSIFYNDKTTRGKALGNVHVVDTSEKITIQGGKVTFYEKDSMYTATDSALFIEYSSRDTLYLHGDTLFSHYDTTLKSRIVNAYHKVKFYNLDMQGMCDSLSMIEKDSLISMFDVPVLWVDSNELKADSIVIKYHKGDIDSVHFKQNAFVLTLLDSNKYNQIKGDLMIGYFTKNKLRKLNVFENSKTIYYPKDKEEYIGINEASSQNMNIYFSDNQVKKIVFLKPNESSLSPVTPSTNNKLPGFTLYFDHRPETWHDVFIWDFKLPITESEEQSNPVEKTSKE